MRGLAGLDEGRFILLVDLRQRLFDLSFQGLDLRGVARFELLSGFGKSRRRRLRLLRTRCHCPKPHQRRQYYCTFILFFYHGISFSC